MPTVFRKGNLRFFFYSREETRRHIHIISPDGTGKFWLEPYIELANSVGLTKKDLTTANDIINIKHKDFIDAWNKHFTL